MALSSLSSSSSRLRWARQRPRRDGARPHGPIRHAPARTRIRRRMRRRPSRAGRSGHDGRRAGSHPAARAVAGTRRTPVDRRWKAPGVHLGRGQAGEAPRGDPFEGPAAVTIGRAVVVELEAIVHGLDHGLERVARVLGDLDRAWAVSAARHPDRGWPRPPQPCCDGPSRAGRSGAKARGRQSNDPDRGPSGPERGGFEACAARSG